MGFGAAGGQLGHQPIGAAADRHGDQRFPAHVVADASRRVLQRLPRVQRLGPGEIEIHLVDRCGLDDRCEPLENGDDLPAEFRTRFA